MTDNIKELVERFQNRLNEFCSNQYKEVHLRQEFIDRFFEILSWDMYGERAISFINREVILEDKVQIEGKSKAPDYGFYIGGKRQFFLEAKRASLDIFSDKESAFQLRRYGWSASLPISILTNFKQLAIYDCRIKPERDDFASKARIAKFGFEEYVDKWDELYSLLSREAVQNGSLTTLLEAEKLKVFESQPVDDAFLAEIEDWRLELAPNIFERNDLDIRDLNFAVQAIINRIIFLRLCEDKGIEPYEQLLEIAKSKQIYQKLSKFFKQADKRYNAGLFHFYKERWRSTAPDKWTLSLQISDKYLQRIIQSLYPPNTPYEFSVIPIEILGHVYEQFLGKIIVLDNKQLIQVENKPEVKKAGGVYYTPEYIVNYIVENTVGKLLENKTPDEVSKLSILDPACGSGSFLIGAYTYLLDWHLNYYLKHLEAYQDVMVQVAEKNWQLTSKEKKRILLNNIYGVDIDQQAVEISKLSLLLKVLEGETEKSIDYQLELYKERALPDLDNNIKCGNSLINNDFYDNEQNDPENEELRYRINAFDWEEEFAKIMGNGGFDVVIGNPPYVRPHNIPKKTKIFLWDAYSTFVAKSDLYSCFMDKALSLTQYGGLFSFIVPKTWTSLESFTKIRQLFIKNAKICRLIQLPRKVFANATVETCIFIIMRVHNDIDTGSNQINIDKLTAKNSQVHFVRSFFQRDIEEAYLYNFQLYSGNDSKKVISKIQQHAKLAEYISFLYGFKTADDKKFIQTKKKYHDSKPFIRSAAIKRYWHNYPIEFIWYVPKKMRENKKTARPGDSTRFEAEKIMVARMNQSIVATYDPGGLYVKDAMLLLSNGNEYSLKYFLGIINSKLLTYFYKEFFITIDVLKNALLSLPIRTIDFDNLTEKKQHDQMVKWVEQMLILHQQLNDATSNRKKETIQRQINRTDKKIDQLVYELYDLTPDEIAIVEESC